MSEHKIGEQEKMVLADGKQHMIKYVDDNGHWKDLGILNEDGLLPCPFCGEYPLVENAYEGVSGHNTPDGFWRISCFGKNHEMAFFSGNTRQQAIDAWNRRV